MSISLRSRLLLSLLAGVAALSMAFALFENAAETHAQKGEVQRQALVLARSEELEARQLLAHGSPADLQAFVDRFQNQPGLALYDANGKRLAITSGAADSATQSPEAVLRALRTGRACGEFYTDGGADRYALALPLGNDHASAAALAVFRRVVHPGGPFWGHALAGCLQALLIVVFTWLILHWSLSRPVHRLTQWLHDLRTGKAPPDSEAPREQMFESLTTEAAHLAVSLRAARAAATEEARLRGAAQTCWTAEMLRVSVRNMLEGSRLFAVSNREPYEHSKQAGSLSWQVPPSGLVTALEPVLRACDGTWIAQATGDADRDAADSQGRLRVPPDHPQYTLRRVWLTETEEQGYYLGFANEGLWPLCHIAHTRPIFRAEDWKHYCVVNRKFADALLEEMEGEQKPLVLVQDYHFALLPRMIKEARPDARVAIFWHIPWPNPEAFGICPWQRELLEGMLGADLIGFHIQAHCNNFLETADRALECRTDWAHFAVERRDHPTAVRPFPVSVEYSSEPLVSARSACPNREAMLRQFSIEDGYLGVGVDRLDYTKGIPERFRAIERLLEMCPEYQRRLTFVQIGAPSRTDIKRYRDFIAEVEEEAERINRRFRSGAWKPIALLARHHSHHDILPYYLVADFCLVTSLHDGMNLVAKEYVAARDDLKGALILSRFTGASHELSDALIVNPYDTDELAGAIHRALNMPAEEQSARIERMRAVIREHNVYRWAGSLISQLAGIRLDSATSNAESAGRVLIESVAE